MAQMLVHNLAMAVVMVMLMVIGWICNVQCEIFAFAKSVKICKKMAKKTVIRNLCKYSPEKEIRMTL